MNKLPRRVINPAEDARALAGVLGALHYGEVHQLGTMIAEADLDALRGMLVCASLGLLAQNRDLSRLLGTSEDELLANLCGSLCTDVHDGPSTST